MKKTPIIKAMALLFFGVAQAQTIPTESDTHVQEHSHESIISSGGEARGAAGSINYSIGQLLHHSSEKSVHHGVQHIFQGCQDTLACNYDGNVTHDDGSCNYPGFGIDTQVHCDSYQWIDGETYTESNTTATHTLQTVNGCDSVVTLNLTINNNNEGFSSVEACDSYTWDGVAYTTSGEYTNTYTNTAGCDSLHTLTVTINHPLSHCDVCENGIYLDQDADGDGVCDADEVLGCQDASACNYNSLATDAGACIYSTDLDACATCSGETDGTGQRI